MTEINFTINGEPVSCEKDEMLLQVALERDFDIPRLCYHESEPPYGACRLCLVEITEGDSSWIEASCTFPVRDEGIEVRTETEEVRRLRRMNMELLLAQEYESEKLRELAAEMGVEQPRFPADTDDDCISCGLCVNICRDLIGAGAISFAGRGPDRRVQTPYDEPSEDCIGCGACAEVCPTGHIRIEDSDGIREVIPFHTEHRLVPCPNCGEGYVTEKQLELLDETLGEGAEYLRSCERCRRRSQAEKLQEQYRKITSKHKALEV